MFHYIPNLGDHNYHHYTRDNQRFRLTFGDCEHVGSRRFIESLNQHIIDSLFDSIYNTIWLANRYDVRNHAFETYLLGQNSTQDFINIVATQTTFFGLLPDYVCLATVGFYPFSCEDTRWGIELDFGSANEFHINYDPNSASAPSA